MGVHCSIPMLTINSHYDIVCERLEFRPEPLIINEFTWTGPTFLFNYKHMLVLQQTALGYEGGFSFFISAFLAFEGWAIGNVIEEQEDEQTDQRQAPAQFKGRVAVCEGDIVLSFRKKQAYHGIAD